MRRYACGLLALCAALVGCSGGGDGRPGEAGAPAGQPRLRPGEYRSPPELCGAITAGTLRRLHVDDAGLADGDGRCQWTSTSRGLWGTKLRVTASVYTPPPTRPGYSATDEARYRFRRPPGWANVGAGAPIRGFGDEAKIARVLFSVDDDLTQSPRSRAVIGVRHRNLIVEVGVEYRADEVFITGRRRVPPVAELESGLTAAAGEVLRALRLPVPPAAAAPPPSPAVSASPAPSASSSPTATPAAAATAASPAPAVPQPGRGEIASARDVCDRLAGDAASLIPGSRRTDLSAENSAWSSGCYWRTEARRPPTLIVEVEAVPASRLTGESGTALASALLPHWPGQRDVSGLGNEAIARQESSKLSRWEPEYDTYLVVRRANLLAYVHYGRWSPPSKAEMDRDALRLAKKILAAYPS